MKTSSCALYNACWFKILPYVRPFIKSESWQVIGFCPHLTSTEMFRINLSTLYPSVGSFVGGVQHSEPGNRTIKLYHPHLAIEVYNLNFGEAPSIRKAEFGALYKPKLGKADSSPEAEKVFKDLRPLERWPALASSWQSVFGFLYWGARPEELGYNRISSPSASLADIAERKVPKHGSRANPTIDPRHDSGLMHIML